MGGLDDLYQQLILDHYRNRRGRGRIENASASVHEHNPVCGDECFLDILVEDNRIVEIRADGDGCSISQAAASMLTEVVADKDLNEALEIVEHFRRMMHGDAEPDEDLLGVVRRHGQDHLRAVSARPSVSKAVADVIVERGDDETLGTLLRNDGAQLSRKSSEAAVERVQNDTRARMMRQTDP